MANQTGTNLHVIDTAANSKISGTCYLRLLQWIDDNADMADDDDLVISWSGQTITIKYQKTTDVGSAGVVYYQMGPFNPGMEVTDLEITTIDKGSVLIFID